MSSLWILLTLVACAIQSARTVMQRNLAERLAVAGVTYARFLYGLPLAIAYALAAAQLAGVDLPSPTPLLLAYTAVGAVAQIFSNFLFVKLLRIANFTISNTYIKTETVLAALFSYLLVGDGLSPAGIVGVLLTLIGVLVIAAGRERLSARSLVIALADRAAFLGLSIGTMAAIASTVIRASALSLPGVGFLVQATYVLAWLNFFQFLFMGVWLAATAPTLLFALSRQWRVGVGIGITGVTASVCWYSAFALQKVAYVLAVGQVELALSYAISRLVYKERATAIEMAGVAVTVAGIVCVALAR